MDPSAQLPPREPVLVPPRRTRLADHVATALLDAILDGRFPAGTKLPPERDLARDLDVNRTSLRQAIGRLEQMGVVEARQGRGTTVRDVSTAASAELMAHLVARDRRRMLRDLFEVRTALAGLVGRLAAERATAAERRGIRAAFEGVEQAVTARERQAHELEVFDRLVRAGRNRALAGMQAWVDQAYGDAAEVFSSAFADGGAVVEGLRGVVEAVEAGDADIAAAATTAYAIDSADRLLGAVGTGRRTGRRAGGRA